MNDPTKVKRAANVLREWLSNRHPHSKGMMIALRNLDDEVLVQRSRQSKPATKILEQAGLLYKGFSLLEMVIVLLITSLLAMVFFPSLYRQIASANSNAVAQKIARVVNAEQVYAMYGSGYVNPIYLTTNVSQPASCANPGLLSGQDAQLTAPGYAITVTLDNSGGAPANPLCPTGQTGFGHFAIAATPLIANGRYFTADTNASPRGALQYHDGASGSWNPYTLANLVPYTLTVVANNVSTQPPTAINNTVVSCGTVTPQNICGTLTIAGPAGYTCYPSPVGVVSMDFNGACLHPAAGSPPGGNVPLAYETPVGSNGGYSTFAISLLSLNPYLDGASVGIHEIVRASLLDLITGTTLATCDIPGAQATDPGFTAVAPYNFCSAPLTTKPNPGDILAIQLFTPIIGGPGNSETSTGADGINWTVL